MEQLKRSVHGTIFRISVDLVDIDIRLMEGAGESHSGKWGDCSVMFGQRLSQMI